MRCNRTPLAFFFPRAGATWFGRCACNGRLHGVGELQAVVAAHRRDALLHEPARAIAAGTGGGTAREVHDRQHYELVNWRAADEDLNYRRFFAINTLAGLRVEDPAIFDATHALVLDLVRSAGGRVLSVEQYRIGQDSAGQQRAGALGQALVAGAVIPGRMQENGNAYVALRCVI